MTARLLAVTAAMSGMAIAADYRQPVPPQQRTGYSARGPVTSQQGTWQNQRQPYAGRGGDGRQNQGRGPESTARNGGDDDSDNSPDQKLIESIESAESLNALSKLQDRAASSRNAEVRQAMVNALADKGAKAMDSLAYFIADADREVSDAAFLAWSSALQDLPVNNRAAAICSAANAIQRQSQSPRGGMQNSQQRGGGQYMQRGGMQQPQRSW